MFISNSHSGFLMTVFVLIHQYHFKDSNISSKCYTFEGLLPYTRSKIWCWKHYCWRFTKSCTSWDVWNPVNDGIIFILSGAGFQPSTVVLVPSSDILRRQISAPTSARIFDNEKNDVSEHWSCSNMPPPLLGSLCFTSKNITCEKPKNMWALLKRQFFGSGQMDHF